MNGNSVHVGFEPNSQRAATRATAARRYPAYVARQIALAHVLQRRVDRGEFADHVAMARDLGFTYARISQLLYAVMDAEVLLALHDHLVELAAAPSPGGE